MQYICHKLFSVSYLVLTLCGLTGEPIIPWGRGLGRLVLFNDVHVLHMPYVAGRLTMYFSSILYRCSKLANQQSEAFVWVLNIVDICHWLGQITINIVAVDLLTKWLQLVTVEFSSWDNVLARYCIFIAHSSSIPRSYLRTNLQLLQFARTSKRCQ